MSDEPTRFADVDFSRWPVIVITYPNIASAAAVERMFHEVDERIRTHAEPVVVIGDLTPLRVSTANAKVRRAFAERVAAQGRMHLAGEAAVLRNPVSRGFVTAYYWLAPAEHPTGVFRTVEEAVAWAHEVLA